MDAALVQARIRRKVAGSVPLAACLTLLAGLLLSSCAADQARLVENVETPVSGVSLELDPASFDCGGRLERLRLISATGPRGELQLDIVAEGAQDLRSLYFNLSYDPLRYRLAAAQTVFLPGAEHETLSLQLTDEPGLAAFGQVMLQPLQRSSGFSGNACVARLRLRPGQAERTRRVSLAPASDDARSFLQFDELHFRLSWAYVNPGDYNQDGQVLVSDLTPLGVHFGEESPGDSFSIEAVIDGNGDGLINIGDLTTIGLNFRRRVSAYRLFRSADPSQHYPESNTEASSLAPLLELPFSSVLGDAATTRRYFRIEAPESNVGDSYWVRPTDTVPELSEGTPSNHDENDGQGLWEIQDLAAGLQVEDKSLCLVEGRPALAFYDAGAGDLKYMRATNSTDTLWTTPVTVDSHVAPADNTGFFCDLEYLPLSSAPVLSYYDGSVADLRYCIANDGTGSSWAMPLAVDTSGAVGLHNSMTIGAPYLPCMAYYDFDNQALKFAQASLGFTVDTIASPFGAGQIQIVPASGERILVFAYDAASFALRVFRLEGGEWASLPILDSAASRNFSAGRDPILGKVAVAWVDLNDDSNRVLRSALSIDGSGDEWLLTTAVSEDVGPATPALAFVDYGVSVAYCNEGVGLMFVEQDWLSPAWYNPREVDSGPLIGDYISLIDLADSGGGAAIAYSDQSLQLKFARRRGLDSF